MGKFIGGLLCGIFVGAAVTEVIERRPELIAHLKHRGRALGDRLREAAASLEETVRSRLEGADLPQDGAGKRG